MSPGTEQARAPAWATALASTIVGAAALVARWRAVPAGGPAGWWAGALVAAGLALWLSLVFASA